MHSKVSGTSGREPAHAGVVTVQHLGKISGAARNQPWDGSCATAFGVARMSARDDNLKGGGRSTETAG
jgi:hypothetical protein